MPVRTRKDDPDGGSELARYRRTGGMAGVRQELRVYEDGRIQLLDRRTGASTEVHADAAGLDRIRSLIDSVPATRWHGLAGAIARRLLPRHQESLRAEVHRGGQRLDGSTAGDDPAVAALVAELDELVARAVRERRDASSA